MSPHAGTTRDVIEVHLDLGGYPAIVADTGGPARSRRPRVRRMPRSSAAVMRRASASAEAADLKILVLDASAVPDASVRPAWPTPPRWSSQQDRSRAAAPWRWRDIASTRCRRRPAPGSTHSSGRPAGRSGDVPGGRRTAAAPAITCTRHRAALADPLRGVGSAPWPALSAELDRRGRASGGGARARPHHRPRRRRRRARPDLPRVLHATARAKYVQTHLVCDRGSASFSGMTVGGDACNRT